MSPQERRERISDAELRVLRAYVEAGSYRATASQLGLHEQTVKNHLSAVRSKLHVRTTAQAVFVLYPRLVA